MALGCDSGDKVGSIGEKITGRKSHETIPFSLAKYKSDLLSQMGFERSQGVKSVYKHL
jgi:hypothetical protein